MVLNLHWVGGNVRSIGLHCALRGSHAIALQVSAIHLMIVLLTLVISNELRRIVKYLLFSRRIKVKSLHRLRMLAQLVSLRQAHVGNHDFRLFVQFTNLCLTLWSLASGIKGIFTYVNLLELCELSYLSNQYFSFLEKMLVSNI